MSYKGWSVIDQMKMIKDKQIYSKIKVFIKTKVKHQSLKMEEEQDRKQDFYGLDDRGSNYYS